VLGKGIVKNRLILSAGTAIASLIPVLLQPILRRLYSPDDFGAFSVYLNIIGILVVISTFRYELAIVLPESDRRAANVSFLSIMIAFIFNVIILGIIILWHETIMDLFNFPKRYSYWLYYVPLSALLFSSFNVMNYWLIRRKNFRSSASCKIVRRSVEGGIQFVASKTLYSGAGLFLGDLFGQFANLLAGVLMAARNGLSFRGIHRRTIRKVMVKYNELAIYNTLPTLLNTITLAMPIFLVNKFFSETETGQLDLARLILFIPLVFLSEPLAQVFFQYANEKKIKKLRIIKQAQKIMGVLLIMAIIGLLIIQLWSDNLVNFFFGKEWYPGAEFTRILIFSVSLRFIIDPFRLIFAAFEKIKILSAWQIFYFLSVTSLIFFKGITITCFLTAFVIIESFCYLLLLLLVMYVLKSYEKQLCITENA